jgi:propionate CoA-transferase
MRTVPVLTGAEAAQLITGSAVITISSSSGLGCPDAVLEAIGQRYEETGSPANLTTLHPIAAGDMYGIKGIDHLCRPGQLRRVLAGSYPSGGSKLDPPLVRELIHNDQIQALNIPFGVLFQMHRAASTGQPGVMTEVGLGTYTDPRLVRLLGVGTAAGGLGRVGRGCRWLWSGAHRPGRCRLAG